MKKKTKLEKIPKLCDGLTGDEKKKCRAIIKKVLEEEKARELNGLETTCPI